MYPTIQRQQTILTRWLAFAFLCACLCHPFAAAASSVQAPKIVSGSASYFLKTSATDQITVTMQNVSGAPLSVSVSPSDRSGSRPLTVNTDYTHQTSANASSLTLTHSLLASLDLGTYYADVVYGNGQLSFPFYILAENTVIFVTQPETTTVDIGDDATFSVEVTGSSGYTFQWQRKSRTGWKNLSKATGSTLILKNVKGYLQGYHYRCKVSSAAGDAYSDEVRLFMYNVPATGDSSAPILYACSALLALAGMIGCLLFSCRRKEVTIKGRT